MPDAMAHNHRGSMDGVHLNYADLRNHLLASDRHACVTRELWNNGRCIYTDLRSHIMYQKARAHATYPPNTTTIASRASHPSGEGSVAGDLPALSPASQPSSSISFQPSAAYTFVGMRCVFDDSQSAVTLIKFANVRCDLLAYGDVEGNLWLVRDIQGPKATPIKAPPVHRRAITALDWSPDNTYLLTTSLDGLTVWDVAALCPIRTIATPVPANAITTAIFHCLSANMVLAGTASGMIDAINTSTGAITLNVPIFKKPQRSVHVSVLEVSAHHVFIGDSTGWLHLHKQEIPRAGQLSGLTHTSRVRIPGSDAAAPLVGCMYLAFCQATASPALLVTARDSTIAIVKVAKEHLLEVHMRCGVAPMAREIRAVVCPLSVLHCDLPRIVMGSEDTGVHIYNLSAIKAPGTPGRSGAGHGGGMLGKPLLVNTLRGHRAPVASVSWAFDETFLASADCDGMVIVWERANV